MPTTLPSSNDNKNSASKRKLEDCDDEDPSSDNASDARTGKKVKQESQDDDESSFIPLSEATTTENLVIYSTPTTLFPFC
jgi:hypothetical protein